MIENGIYKHYKGHLYEVIGTGKHSETLEDVVIYKAKYTSEYSYDAIWVRPLSMFKEEIEFNGEKVLRFSYIGKWIK